MAGQQKRRPERKRHRTDHSWRNSKEPNNVEKLHNGLIVRELMEEKKEEDNPLPHPTITLDISNHPSTHCIVLYCIYKLIKRLFQYNLIRGAPSAIRPVKKEKS